MKPNTLRTNPDFTMSISCIALRPKIIAFGGVPAGKVKAKEQERVIGRMNFRGFACRALARLSIKGINTEAVVMLEENSVKNVTMTPEIIKKAQSGMLLKLDSDSLIKSDSLERSTPLAIP